MPLNFFEMRYSLVESMTFSADKPGISLFLNQENPIPDAQDK